MESMKERVMSYCGGSWKMLLILPAVLIPLLTLGFYAMGGGSGGKTGKGIGMTKGLNMSLPEAKIKSKGKGLNKLRVLPGSQIRIRFGCGESRKKDPYFGWKDTAVAMAGGGRRAEDGLGVGGMDPAHSGVEVRAKELLQKLDQLKGVIGKQERGVIADSPGAASYLSSMEGVGRAGSRELLAGSGIVTDSGVYA